MALKETMRLYPSAPFIGRQAVEDDQIGSYHIPAGTEVVLAPRTNHITLRPTQGVPSHVIPR